MWLRKLGTSSPRAARTRTSRRLRVRNMTEERTAKEGARWPKANIGALQNRAAGGEGPGGPSRWNATSGAFSIRGACECPPLHRTNADSVGLATPTRHGGRVPPFRRRAEGRGNRRPEFFLAIYL